MTLPGGIMTLPRLFSRCLPWWFIDISLAFFQHGLFTENVIGLVGVKKSSELQYYLLRLLARIRCLFLLSSDMLKTCIIYKFVSQHRPVDTNPSLATDVNHGGFTSYANYNESYGMMHHACTTESTRMVLPDHKWRCQSSYQTILLALYEGCMNSGIFWHTQPNTFPFPCSQAKKRKHSNHLSQFLKRCFFKPTALYIRNMKRVLKDRTNNLNPNYLSALKQKQNIASTKKMK